MENAYDRRERTVYVSGMHRTVTEEHLYDLFQKAGPIEKVILKENQDGSPQHALVVFKNVDSVMYSIAYLQATQLGDQPINIRPLRESSHHSALESAIAQQTRFSGGVSGQTSLSADQMQQSPMAGQQTMPYYLRSHARAAQGQQTQTQQTQQCYQSASPQQQQYTGSLGASLFGPLSMSGSFYGSGGGGASTSFYGSGGGASTGRPQLFASATPSTGAYGSSTPYRTSAQAAPGYGRYGGVYASHK